MNRKLSSQSSSKLGKANNEALHESNSLKKCKRKKPLFFFCVFLAAVGTVCFFMSFHSESLLMRKDNKRWDDYEERARILLQRYNVSKKQLHALISFFSVSDQVICLCF